MAAAGPAPAGDGVAGGLDVVVEAGFRCGAAGVAGVNIDVDGVEGVAGFGAGGPAFG